MGKIKRILAVFLLVMMIFIEIPISVKAADSSGRYVYRYGDEQ